MKRPHQFPTKLVLYSGGQDPKNHLLHAEVVSLTQSDSKQKRMTYFAFCSENAKLFYHRFVRRYKSHGIKKFQCFVLDLDHSAQEIRNALSTDIIYISGGNTFYILHHLKRLGMLPLLRNFSKRGGVLAGLSAGAIIMTRSIALAGYPTFDADENEVGLKDLNALNLTNFEFFPHYTNTKKLNDALLKYSLKVDQPIYACADGNGIVIDRKKFSSLGPLHIFHKGRLLHL